MHSTLMNITSPVVKTTNLGHIGDDLEASTIFSKKFVKMDNPTRN